MTKGIDNVILDRDGTVIVDKHYLHDPEGVELETGVGPVLCDMARSGLRLFLATNQSGIGRGYFEEKDYLAVQERLARILARYGAGFEDVAFCPHAPEDGCGCRKPDIGQWLDLAETNKLAPDRTAMIGDKLSDVAFGRRAGLAACVLVLTGKGRETAADNGLPAPESGWAEVPDPAPGHPHAVAADLAAAWDWLRNSTGEESA